MNAQTKANTIKIRKEASDTIDYTYMMRLEGWHLTKVLDNQVRSLYNCNKRLWFSDRTDSALIRRAFFERQINLQMKDTVMAVWWYITNGCVMEECGHDDYIWKLTLNRNSNTMTMDRLFCPRETKLVKLRFKVIKFSKFEIILEDLQVKSVRRRYFFQKN